MPRYDGGTNFSGTALKMPHPKLLAMVAAARSAVSAPAAPAADPCAVARDPVRCEARREALKTCADRRGAERQACLDAHIPPPDCRRAEDPRRCEAEQLARELCRGKTDAALRKCLREQHPRKARGTSAPKA
jgi:hypothetical protein